MRLLSLKIFSVAALSFFGCAANQQAFSTPELALEGIRTSVRDDRRLDFLGSLSNEMLRDYEHAILVAWPEVRSSFGFLADDAKVESIEPFTALTRQEAGELGRDPAWIWPDSEDAETVRVRLRVTIDGESLTEDLLLIREELPQEEGTDGSRYIRVGEQWFLRDRHPNPARYRATPSGPTTGWKLLAPYLPFQGNSRLSQILQERQDPARPPSSR